MELIANVTAISFVLAVVVVVLFVPVATGVGGFVMAVMDILLLTYLFISLALCCVFAFHTYRPKSEPAAA